VLAHRVFQAGVKRSEVGKKGLLGIPNGIDPVGGNSILFDPS
jgi:hypothetical protein